ncbi:hypothetical protein ACLMJK_000353 [Lecanora helva]
MLLALPKFLVLSAESHSLHPVGVTSRIFHYDRAFGSAPSNESDAAWASLFPAQGGFFKHPTLAPHRSAFAVFHQLHCLEGIRQGYWMIYDNVLEGRQMKEEDFPFMSSPSHIRHCVDLLRQSLMCRPDTTIEVKNEELGGVTGFGTEHQCRDWGQLSEWTVEWEGWRQDPREEKEGGDHGHDHGGHKNSQ